jgi:hypothetical protein
MVGFLRMIAHAASRRLSSAGAGVCHLKYLSGSVQIVGRAGLLLQSRKSRHCFLNGRRAAAAGSS